MTNRLFRNASHTMWCAVLVATLPPAAGYAQVANPTENAEVGTPPYAQRSHDAPGTISTGYSGATGQATTSLGNPSSGVTIGGALGGVLAAGPWASASLTTPGPSMDASGNVSFEFEILPTIGAPVGTKAYFDVTAIGMISGSVTTVASGTPVEVGTAAASMYLTDLTIPETDANYYKFSGMLDGAAIHVGAVCYSGAAPQTGCMSTSGAPGGLPQTIQDVGTGPLPVYVGDLVSVAIEANVSAAANANLSAMIDPMITLDPKDPAGLTLAFSPGVVETNPSQGHGVPEPSAGWLWLAGIGGLAATWGARRRRPRVR